MALIDGAMMHSQGEKLILGVSQQVEISFSWCKTKLMSHSDNLLFQVYLSRIVHIRLNLIKNRVKSLYVEH